MWCNYHFNSSYDSTALNWKWRRVEGHLLHNFMKKEMITYPHMQTEHSLKLEPRKGRSFIFSVHLKTWPHYDLWPWFVPIDLITWHLTLICDHWPQQQRKILRLKYGWKLKSITACGLNGYELPLITVGIELPLITVTVELPLITEGVELPLITECVEFPLITMGDELPLITVGV